MKRFLSNCLASRALCNRFFSVAKPILSFSRLTTNKRRRAGIRNLKMYHDLLLPKSEDGALKIAKKKEVKVTYEATNHASMGRNQKKKKISG